MPTSPDDSTNRTHGWTFLRNFAQNPSAVGAVAPSSPALTKLMLDWFDFETVRGIVEFGPGTGVFTEGIRKRLNKDAKFFAIERSTELANITRNRCPGVKVFEDSAVNVKNLCDAEAMETLDAVVCGLPWASFPSTLQDEILEATIQQLRPGGQFATFAYWQGVILPAGIRFARKLKTHFSEVKRSQTAWRNLPPAFVYRCVK